MVKTWGDRARASLPEDTPFPQRVAALREGYSFGTRDLHLTSHGSRLRNPIWRDTGGPGIIARSRRRTGSPGCSHGDRDDRI